MDDYDPKNPTSTRIIVPAGQDEAAAIIQATKDDEFDD